MLNLDQASGLWYYDHNGIKRVMGCQPTPDTHAMKAVTRFSQKFSLLPRSQWADKSNFKWIGRVSNQGQYGSCVAHGTWGGFTGSWNASGRVPQLFSPVFVYGLINGGRDQGANVGDALTVLQTTGMGLEKDVPEGMIFQSQFPPNAIPDAAPFKATEALYCPSFDEMGTAIQLDMFPVFGIDIGGNFEPDTNGVIPDYARSWQYGGHCMMATGTKIINGRNYLEVLNSWDYSWGLNGLCYMPESYFLGQSPDNWVIMVGGVTDDQPLTPPTP